MKDNEVLSLRYIDYFFIRTTVCITICLFGLDFQKITPLLCPLPLLYLILVVVVPRAHVLGIDSMVQKSLPQIWIAIVSGEPGAATVPQGVASEVGM